jgi:hypothetical protein
MLFFISFIQYLFYLVLETYRYLLVSLVVSELLISMKACSLTLSTLMFHVQLLHLPDLLLLPTYSIAVRCSFHIQILGSKYSPTYRTASGSIPEALALAHCA